jgi:hypothetical protein
MTQHAFTTDHIEKILKDAYNITYDNNTHQFQIPDEYLDLDPDEDTKIEIDSLIKEYKNLLHT